MKYSRLLGNFALSAILGSMAVTAAAQSESLPDPNAIKLAKKLGMKKNLETAKDCFAKNKIEEKPLANMMGSEVSEISDCIDYKNFFDLVKDPRKNAESLFALLSRENPDTRKRGERVAEEIVATCKGKEQGHLSQFKECAEKKYKEMEKEHMLAFILGPSTIFGALMIAALALAPRKSKDKDDKDQSNPRSSPREPG